MEISWNAYKSERATSHLGGVFLSLPVYWLTLISFSSMSCLPVPDTKNSTLEFHLCSTSTQNSASLWLKINKFCTIYLKTYREKGPLVIRSWPHLLQPVQHAWVCKVSWRAFVYILRGWRLWSSRSSCRKLFNKVLFINSSSFPETSVTQPMFPEFHNILPTSPGNRERSTNRRYSSGK